MLIVGRLSLREKKEYNMKCKHCGYEDMKDPESIAACAMVYVLIAIFGAGVVGIGCLFILAYL